MLTNLSKTGEAVVLLEPKDLRIGNILLYKGMYVHVTNLSLDIDDEYEETIGFCKLGETTNEMGGWNRNICADLKPILLTPELLGDAGFHKDEDWVIIVGFNFTSSDQGYVCGDINGANTPLKYIHQLQNFFYALVGTELPMNFLQK